MRNAILAICLVSFGAFSAQAASIESNPEFRLVQGLFAAAGDNLSSSQGQALYQAQVDGLLQTYSTEHTSNTAQALQNMTAAFETFGVPSPEIAQIRAVSAHYAQNLNKASLQDYARDLSSALASVRYPQGAQFSACQWSIGITAVGLAVGLPETIYAVGQAMGDQTAPAIVADSGVILLLIGLGGAVAILPTCL